uniref:DUF4485 domain-containing protein n=1 Tax=Timema cristinae TaxID=61476 RepID=A0A7R9GWI5_TIMCR|nr:unnamed protein product [Timema cristinae]
MADRLAIEYDSALKDIYKFSSLFTPVEQNLIQKWVDKLCSENQMTTSQNIRNGYARFLSYMLRRGKLIYPFSQDPPPTSLRPLQEILKEQITPRQPQHHIPARYPPKPPVRLCPSYHPVRQAPRPSGISCPPYYPGSSGSPRPTVRLYPSYHAVSSVPPRPTGFSCPTCPLDTSHLATESQFSERPLEVIQGEDMDAIVQEVNDLGDTITLTQMIATVSPHTYDKGEVLKKIMHEEMLHFRQLLNEVYSSKSKDIEHEMARDQIKLRERYEEWRKVMLTRLAQAKRELKKAAPSFDWKEYSSDKNYIHNLFHKGDGTSTTSPEVENQNSARAWRQKYFHKLQCLKQHIKRLRTHDHLYLCQTANERMQEQLQELRRQNQDTQSTACDHEQELNDRNVELAMVALQLRDERDNLSEEVAALCLELEHRGLFRDYQAKRRICLFVYGFAHVERHLVYQWIEKLKGCSYSTDEMRLRNDFMFYLVTNLQSGELRSPFRRAPPKGPLARALVGHYDDADGGESDEFMSSSDTDSHRKPLSQLSRPPASGKFLVPQPMPSCGAFCYLSVLSKGDNGILKFFEKGSGGSTE